MKLPKLEYPTYETELPWSGKTITYRPYSVSEEKILLMAATGGEASKADHDRAIAQVIENCCNVKLAELHPCEVEWLFIKLRIASVSPILEVTYFTEGCTTEECPHEIQAYVDLNEAKITGLDSLVSAGFTRKNDSWITMLNDSVGVQMADIKEIIDQDEYDPILDCITAIFDQEEVYETKDFSKEELMEFIGDMPAPYSEKLFGFFKNQPKLTCQLDVTCPKCNKIHSSTIEGLSSFFD